MWTVPVVKRKNFLSSDIRQVFVWDPFRFLCFDLKLRLFCRGATRLNQTNMHDMLTSCFNLSLSRSPFLLASTFFFLVYILPIISPVGFNTYAHSTIAHHTFYFTSNLHHPLHISPRTFSSLPPALFLPCAPVLRGLAVCTVTGQSRWISIWECSCPHCSTRPPKSKWTVSWCPRGI